MKKLLVVFTAFQLFAFNTLLFAQEIVDHPPSRDQGFGQTMIMVTIALVFFYFILWRPEQKRRKEMDDLRTGMEKGDRVTAMGIIGTVSKVQDDTVVLKMYDGSKIEFLKAAITEVHPSEGSKAAAQS
ncbi:MAG: preprotein translocase subunit YajC [Waddliaceae bacterium]|nr:preprotein translocase subunit YajC [Waddliaceae bacterium]